MSETDIDRSSWLTKQQAAEAIGVTTKTIERLAAAGKLQQGAWSPQGRGPARAVYHPADVARLAQERRAAPAAFVLPAGEDLKASGNGHGRGGHIESTLNPTGIQLAALPTGEDLWRAVFAAAMRGMSETSQTPLSVDKYFLTVAEAAAVSGLPQADLIRLCQDGDLPHRRTGRGGIRIRKRDLEAL